ncbi:protein tyrosine phosphatase family protein [Mucilaginibacter sp. OK098]|uniref:protein tyrosine phosphatase family protein n=1 Tax=Mucilaginibacter sp. OK098 TaxID=1855297 RepID=UPI00092239CD|nr:protein tyrosine phosphatase family protein [Mucilaginibacter sp. OK098]SHN09785.1 Predicted phosphohydrolase, protein tyrosine phosphatase (PTP) superfamily, DUF442 family [Mucilaginibacter sp. OK098]
MTAIFNFHKVSDIITCSGQPTEEQLKQLATEQYRVIINLAPHNNKFALPDETASVKALDMKYCNIPVAFDNPQLSELTDFIELMRQYSSQKTLVHCAANYRASAFTGLYLFAAEKLNETQMQLFIEEVWQPDAVWQQFIDESLEHLKSQ